MSPAVKIGRPRGQRKAERRLKREIANKTAQTVALSAIADTLREFVRTANSNPVTGLALGIISIDVLYRTKIISFTAAAAFYALFSASVAGGIISDIAQIIPSFGSKDSKDAILPSAGNLTYAFSNGPQPNTTTITGGAVTAEK